ncbi:MAG TPA: acyl-CoA dehydrogenase [Acidimicrobiales bacterium]
MPIAISEDHRQLASVARSFLDKQAASSAARSCLDVVQPGLPPFWGDMAELGWLGLHVDEAFGGAGFGLLELAVVLEELGRAVAPGPFLPTVIASASLAEAGGDRQRRCWLPGLVDGSMTAGVGLVGSPSIPEDGVLSGRWPMVLGAGLAHVLVLAAGEDLVLVDRHQDNVRIDMRENLDPTCPAHTVVLSAVALADEDVIAGGRTVCRRLARVLAAAEAAGGAGACVETATEYAKVRQQFGRTIGTFQAVKHRCAEMLADAERAVAASWDAARTIGSTTQREFAAAVAALESLSGYLSCAKSNIQVHGGIGYTWEHDAHLHLRRAGALAAFVGPLDALAEDVAVLSASVKGGQERIELPAEAEKYRREVQDFLGRVTQLDDQAGNAAFLDEGYAHPHWPRPWGRGASPVEQLVIEEELRGIRRPGVVGIGGWIVLTLIQHASEDQARRWIRPSMEGDIYWCQLFSEPDAGSDAAGIRTKAERVDGGWLVNGQKIWTSGAQMSTHGLATVRTDPEAPKHAGITTMVIDMKVQGVEVRPLREATGNAMFNEVFLSDVFVPDDDVVGPVNSGWTVARSTLGNERVTIGGQGAGSFVELESLYRDHGSEAGAVVPLGRLFSERATLRLMNLRQAERAVAGVPGPEGNLSKMIQAEHAQRTADLAFNLAGEEAAYVDGDRAASVQSFLFTRCLTIAGGTSEIVRNQIAERILGLPRDPLIH